MDLEKYKSAILDAFKNEIEAKEFYAKILTDILNQEKIQSRHIAYM